MKKRQLTSTLALAVGLITVSSFAQAAPWPYDAEAGSIELTHSSHDNDLSATGFRIGYSNLTQSLGGWLWGINAEYVNIDTALGSDWGYAIGGELGYRFPNKIRGIDLDLLAGISTTNETMDVIGKENPGVSFQPGQSGIREKMEIEATWVKLGAGFFAQATPTTDMRVEVGIMQPLDVKETVETSSHLYYREPDTSELRTTYAGVSFRFINRARFPIIASVVGSQSTPYGLSNDAITVSVGLEF